ncbi:MAG: S9 family peptidase [Moraxellaceae bacterium]|nr:S9 family peptidase [Pseudobdellovibrionaceae bacterium]
MKNIKSLFTAVLILATLQSQAQDSSNSTESTYSADWLMSQSARINQKLKQSRNTVKIENLLKLLDKPNEEYLGSFKAGEVENKVILVNRGLGKSQDIVVRQNSGIEEIIFSNFEIKKNNSFRIEYVITSPDSRNLIVVAFKKGSTDRKDLYLINIETKNRKDIALDIKLTSVKWNSSEVIVYSDYSGLRTEYKLSSTAVAAKEPPYTYERPTKLNYALPYDSLIGVLDNFVYLKKSGPNGLGEIRKVLNDPASTESMEVVVSPESNDYLTKAFVVDEQLIIIRVSKNQHIQIINKTGLELANITIPEQGFVREGFLLNPKSWKVADDKIKIPIRSLVNQVREFTYNLKDKHWETESFNQDLLFVDGVQLKSKIVDVIARDGVAVPMRITYRENLAQNGNNPVLFQVYGGFSVAGYMNDRAENNPMLIDFLKKGGIYAAPALRGGNEFGEKWHQAALLSNKKITMLDLIDSARWMVSQNWTIPQKIIITGTSNGGLTVASAALLSPQDFGLVIPFAGVHDLLRKDSWDSEFEGWSFEYGKSSDEKAKVWLKEISPVILAEKVNSAETIPQFLIITGKNDSRVNPKHSYELAEILIKNSSQKEIYLSAINNAGHYLSSVYYQNWIGWRAQVLAWTYIYDFAGF